jgi:hypothetical protein
MARTADRTAQRRRGRRRSTAAPEVAVHVAGTGPDSVFVHAVRPGRQPASGPVAVCGYPLRTRREEIHRDERSFEDQWLDTSDCCTECGSALGLADRDALPTVDEEPGQRNWVLIGSIAALLPMVVGVLVRMAAVALR